MENGQPMCYITYAIPANLMPALPLEGVFSAPKVEPAVPAEPQEIYPPGFMPQWFLRGSFPEDDFED